MTDLEKLKCIKIAVTLGVLCLIFQQGWCVYEAYTKNISLEGPIGLAISGLITLYFYLIYKIWK